MSAPSLQSRVLYLKRCYASDVGRFGITDIFSRKIREKYIVESAGDFLSGSLPLPLEWTVANKFLEQTRLFSVRKKLVLGAFFIVGPLPVPQGPIDRLCAPLWLYDLEIILKRETKTAYADVDLGSIRLNHGALTGWCDDPSSFGFAPPTRWRREDLHRFAAHLDTAHPSFDGLSLMDFPNLVSGAQLKSTRRGPSLQCASAAALLLVERSRASRGLLSDLEKLAGLPEHEFTTPTAELLGHAQSASLSSGQIQAPAIPAILSNTQTQALRSASKHSLSVVVGPPGTGKSFTLAAIALDHAARGQSVLICTRTTAALDAVEARLQEQLSDSRMLVRTGDHRMLRGLKNKLDFWLSGGLSPPTLEDLEATERRFESIQGRLNSVERSIKNCVKHHTRWAGTLNRSDLMSRWRKFWSKYALKNTNVATLLQDYDEALMRSVQVNRERLRGQLQMRLHESLQANRDLIRDFRTAIGARTDLKQKEFFERIDLRALLKSLPIWMSTTHPVSDSLPMERGLFDVALVDEASQSDLASVLPICQRAQRVVVAGDPQQLRHLTFISREEQKRIADEHGLDSPTSETLDYRSTSALDRVSEQLQEQSQIVFLDEHFRSQRSIIRFPNEEFYQGRLKVMRSYPRNEVPALFFNPVKGKRTDDGTNAEEALALCEKLTALVDQAMHNESFGVLSPFRAQVDFLADTIYSRLDSACIEKHSVIVGTAHELQGQERDHMLLSLALDDSSHSAAYRFAEKPDVFNVSVTRARDTQHVFYSFSPEQLPPESILRRYLNVPTDSSWVPDEDVPHDRFLSELAEKLQARKLNAWPMAELGGTLFDLVIGREDRRLGIDLLGYPGVSLEWVGLVRHRMVNRAGHRATAVGYLDWRENKQEVLDRLENSLKC